MLGLPLHSFIHLLIWDVMFEKIYFMFQTSLNNECSLLFIPSTNLLCWLIKMEKAGEEKEHSVISRVELKKLFPGKEV